MLGWYDGLGPAFNGFNERRRADLGHDVVDRFWGLRDRNRLAADASDLAGVDLLPDESGIHVGEDGSDRYLHSQFHQDVFKDGE